VKMACHSTDLVSQSFSIPNRSKSPLRRNSWTL